MGRAFPLGHTTPDTKVRSSFGSLLNVFPSPPRGVRAWGWKSEERREKREGEGRKWSGSKDTFIILMLFPLLLFLFSLILQGGGIEVGRGEESRERSNPLPSPFLPYSIQDTRAYRGMGPNDRSNQPREKRGVENREEKKKKEGKGRGQSSFASFTETNEQKTTLELSEINPAIRANWICRKEELERHSRNENIICNFRLQLITNASF